MKRQKLLKEIVKRGAVFVRHGASHDIYENPQKNVSTQVPRQHRKDRRPLNIEPFELFKPASAPLPALFSKYNDEVLAAVSASIKQLCDMWA